eukprot:Skav223084  [mRNA]  locus=scaffold419:266764:268497:+ [translate_table: standard]
MRSRVKQSAFLVFSSVGLAAISTPEQRRRSQDCALSGRRAVRAALCVGRIAFHYKHLAWKHAGDPSYDLHRSKVHRECADLALQMCRRNGGMFVKMGQHAATLGPAIPPEYVQALVSLQDRAPAGPWSDVMHVVRSELRLSDEVRLAGPGGVFTEFDQDPVGSASLAQVHRARLPNGVEVAVKVQHRGITTVVASDLFIVKCLDRVLSRLFDGFSMAWAIEEFEMNVAHELNFLEEAERANRCRQFFQSHRILCTKVHVPRVHAEMTTSKLLVMDFSSGLAISKLTEVVRRKDAAVPMAPGEERLLAAAKSAAQILVSAFGAMCFSSGFVHCDPHPGNLLIEMGPTQADTKLVILDHGLYCDLPPERRLAMCGLWQAMVLQDDKALQSNARTLGIDASTAELLPIYFTNRSMTTKAGLGQPITIEEKNQLKQQLIESGLLPKESSAGAFAMSGLGMLAERLPADMLMVMRTMHLVAALHRDLGGKPSERFLLYADAAVAGTAGSQQCFPCRFALLAFWLGQLGHAVFRIRFWLKEAYLKCAHSGKGACEHFSIAKCLAEIGRNQEEHRGPLPDIASR